jgi:aquaporin rerated protein, other eukaryote
LFLFVTNSVGQIAFGLWLSGAFNWVRLVCVIPAQFLGAITAAGLVSEILPGPLQAENSVGEGVSTGAGLVTEVFLTAELMMTILMLAVEKSRTTFLAPLTIGISLTIIHLVGKYYVMGTLEKLEPTHRL